MFKIDLAAIIFRFNPDSPDKVEIGVFEDNYHRIMLPYVEWNPTTEMEILVRHLIRNHIVIDEKWLQVELMTILPGFENFVSIYWRTYIPDNLKVQGLDWISYDQLELFSQRIVRHDLKALRYAYNRK